METFATLPTDLFVDSNGMLEEDPSTYFSLSQFDLELQQQAQQALLQENASWQDFDKYLPVMTSNNLRNEQAQPIFNNNNTLTTFNSDPSLLYQPLSSLLPPPLPMQQSLKPNIIPEQSQRLPSPPIQQQQQQQQPMKTLFNMDTLNWENNSVNTTNPIQMNNNHNNNNNNNNNNTNIKQEYASPESLTYSPPQNNNHPTSTSPKQKSTLQPEIPLFQSFNTSESRRVSKSINSSLDLSGWNNVSTSTPIDATQGKVPIQRLKTNNIITNAVNAALNNNTAPVTGRQHKKTAHNAIERRYRNNINDRIAELKNAVPALLYAKVKDNRTGKRSQRDDDEDEGEDGEEFLDGVAVATKLNKATILRKATEYINHLKKTGDDVRRENETLQHILTQLPGGADILKRYHLQKQQREKELHQQQIKEREALKQQEQQRKAANRKRARLNNNSISQHRNSHDHHSDEYESSSSSPDPITPPSMTNRVFMAIFMCITFFSTSPLTSGSSASEEYQNHHHATKSTTPVATENIINTNTTPESFLGSLFKFDDTWSTIRTIIFTVCIAQLLFPYFKHILFGSSLKLKRVNKPRRAIAISPRKENNNTITPGDFNSQHQYHQLEKSIKYQDNDNVPDGFIVTLFLLMKEATRTFCHHILGYDIMFVDYENSTPEQGWSRVMKWIKLNEAKCAGGDPTTSRLSMLYSCFRMLNLVDALDEDRHGFISSIYTRAYATAAMQMSLIIPSKSIADKLSDYFWLHAVTQYGDHLDEDEDEMDESSLLIQSLGWIDPDQDHDSIMEMRDTLAWSETMEIIQNQTAEALSQTNHHSNLSLSYNVPTAAPIAILSNLHLVCSLRNQFDRLVSTIASKNEAPAYNELFETAFSDIMLLTKSDPLQRLPHWLATIGVIVEALWKNKTTDAEKHMTTLIQCVPRSMTCKSTVVSQKYILNQLDELTKKSIIHILIGAILLKSPDMEKQKQGLAELENAQALRPTIRKLQNKSRANAGDEDLDDNLESVVLALVEFVVSFIGLESWIGAMRLQVSVEKEILIDQEVSEIILHLRRMIRYPSLQAITDHQFIVERLSRLGRFIARHPGDTDSACDLSDREDDFIDEVSIEENLDNQEMLLKKADKAQLILRGLA